MKKLFGWLFNRWVISIAALILLALLIWFFGPDIAFSGHAPLESEIARLVAILVVVVVWAAYNIIALLRQRRTNQDVVNGLAAEPAAADAAAMPDDPKTVAAREESDALALRFREALAILREAKLGQGGRRRYLYQLPWYVIIGPPGAGKTTALAHSGLKFPLKDTFGERAVRGAGGTRNCDWFFTDDAVLIDTAGRYTLQESDQPVDRAAWHGFLELLRKHRPKRPIDGILVAFSITEITGGSQSDRLAHARAVKARIQELYGTLKLRAPVYVLFTKCDLVAGFSEFFGNLTPEERAQVWGVTVSLRESKDPNLVLTAFPADFEQLLDRLATRIVARLEEERDVARRSLLLSFPQQIKLLKSALAEFLGELFGQSRFEDPLLVRGIYLTSATQLGSPIDRVIGAVAASFQLQRQALPAFSGRGVSYFLTRLLQDVIFREAGLVTRTGFLSKYRPYLQWAAYGTAAAIIVLMLTLWTVSYFGNRALIADIDAKVDAFKQEHAATLAGRGGPMDVIAMLNGLRALPYGYAERGRSRPLTLNFGLFQGEKLGEAEQLAYDRSLDRLFVPILMGRIEEQIAGNLNNLEFLYQALKAYLMFTTPEHLEPSFLKLWIATDWNGRFAGAERAEFRQQFAQHLDALFDTPIDPIPPANEALVARARAALLQLPLGVRIYSQLKTQQLATKSKDWTLAQVVEPDQLRFFQRRSGLPINSSIPYLFTVAGYRELFVERRKALVGEALKETWVLGPDYGRLQSDSEKADLARKVEELYLTDYIQKWDALVNDLELIPTANTEAQADLVRAIAQPNSPIKAVLQAIASQTQLSKALLAVEPPAGPAEVGQIGQIRQKIENLVGLGGRAEASQQEFDPTQRVDRHFEAINALVRQEGNAPPRIDAALQPFSELYDFLLQTKQAPRAGNAPVEGFAGDFARGRAIIAKLQSSAKSQPEPVARMLAGLASTTQQSTIDTKRADALQRIVQVWRTSIAPACRSALAGRYPMFTSASDDVNIADFAKVFAPGGLLDGFFKQYLQPYADTSVRPWRWIDTKSGGLGFASPSLRMFEDAARIRQAYFPAGTPQPQVSFAMEPVSLDPRARKVELTVGTQSLVNDHGPLTAVRLQWPTAGSAARLAFTPVDNPGQSIAISRSGPWALFHLLDDATLENSGGPDRFQVRFNVQGYQASFLLRAESIDNPFALPELQQFQCRDQL